MTTTTTVTNTVLKGAAILLTVGATLFNAKPIQSEPGYIIEKDTPYFIQQDDTKVMSALDFAVWVRDTNPSDKEMKHVYNTLMIGAEQFKITKAYSKGMTVQEYIDSVTPES